MRGITGSRRAPRETPGPGIFFSNPEDFFGYGPRRGATEALLRALLLSTIVNLARFKETGEGIRIYRSFAFVILLEDDVSFRL